MSRIIKLLPKVVIRYQLKKSMKPLELNKFKVKCLVWTAKSGICNIKEMSKLKYVWKKLSIRSILICAWNLDRDQFCRRISNKKSHLSYTKMTSSTCLDAQVQPSSSKKISWSLQTAVTVQFTYSEKSQSQCQHLCKRSMVIWLAVIVKLRRDSSESNFQ